MTDLTKLFGLDAIQADAEMGQILSQEPEVEEVWLSQDNAEDRPMMLRVALQSTFRDAGLDVNDHVGEKLDSLDGETPYHVAFNSADGLTKAIRAMLVHHKLV